MGGLSGLGKSIGKIGGQVGDLFSSDAGILGAVNPTALLGTALAMGDSLYGAYANKKEAKKEREWQQYMMDYQNAYNTPAAQMARYAEAGLNPNLIYGQQNYSASTGSVPHVSIPGMKVSDHALAALKLGQDLKLGQAQIDQVQANTSLLKQQARGAGANADILENLMLDTPKWMDPREKGTRASVVRAVSKAVAKEAKRKKDLTPGSVDYILAVAAGEI